MSRLQELQERRAHECRLTPDRALETLEGTEAFLPERGLGAGAARRQTRSCAAT